jgi:hypothetical protein
MTQMRLGARTLNEVDLDTSIRVLHKLPVGLMVWQLQDPKDVRSLRCVDLNPAAEREFRAPLSFAIGKPIAACFPKLLDTPAPEVYRRVAVTGTPKTVGELSYHDDHIPDGVFWIACFPLPGRCVGAAMENITDRKRMTENQTRALQVLHRITLVINESSSVLEAAQSCVDEICTQIGWPVGRLFLSDDASKSRFLPNPVWHFSESRRFRAFRKATELYERDLKNKLALEYRAEQGRRAGLTRSIGFKIVENDFLRGVLEFSSESVKPLDENFLRVISNVGIQLGRVFERERAAHKYQTLERRFAACEDSCRGLPQGMSVSAANINACLATCMAELRRNCEQNTRSAGKLIESMEHMTRGVNDTRRISTVPLQFRRKSSDDSIAGLSNRCAADPDNIPPPFPPKGA